MNNVTIVPDRQPQAGRSLGGKLRRTGKFGIIVVIMSLLAAIAAVNPSSGAVPSLDTIRVAIFLNLPGKYQLRTSAATFVSDGGMQIGLREPAGFAPIASAVAGETVRFGLDGYRVNLLETTTEASAVALLKKLQAAGGAGFITALQKSGKKTYQVTEGAYATAAEAKAALDKWNKDAGIVSLLGKWRPAAAGPLYLEAGPYGSLKEAKQAAAAFGDTGVDAFAAIKSSVEPGQAPAYAVFVGGAADHAGLDAVQAAAAGAKGAGTLSMPAEDAKYMLLKQDVSVSGTSSTLYAVPISGTVRAWIQPADERSGIKLAERYGRTYRGSFEMTAYNQSLAVVNELPFEQYLYSVVGAEMPASWPAEALKAQAVTARSYALYQGFGFQIAHVVDTTLSQAYNGIGSEKPSTTAAVEATAGEVIMHSGRIVEAVFSSNAGGVTADPSEIWNSSVPYLGPVPSPDQLAEQGLYTWYRVVLPDSRTGYIREDLVVPTGDKTAAGSEVLTVKGDGVAVRPIPLIQSDVEPVARVNSGTRVVQLEKVPESNAMSWVRGPFTPEQLAATMKGRAQTPVEGAVRTVEAGKRGPSGRVIELLVNGKKLDVRTPDTLRSALGGLPSTRFDIDETGRLAVLSGSGAVRERPADSSPVHAIGASGTAVRISGPGLFVLSGDGEVRAATTETAFRFTGTGFGHGVGLSQWGARGLAEQGYDYQSILKYYYKNVTLEKE